MAVIHVLDKHTAELIAAGEVVERPASVVKELLENAIDAGASQITVTIESGGVKLIEISDNGSGIEAEYIPTAFIRHATSKIRTEDDLNHIHTLGFRGEALASIASVARVEVLTRTENDECASVYRIEGGEDYPLEPGARGVGTTIRVQDLFYNTPARMKFLKKDSSEGTFVADIVAHVALSHPEVSFKFVREGKLQYVTPGDGKLRSAAYAVLGREFSRDLMELDNQEGVYRVWGLITQPRSCRASRSMQYFYINGRYVRNRTMMAAMETAFKGTTMQGKFPGGILLLEMPADLVDVNVHPAKTEVRFARENDIFDLVYHAVKLILRHFALRRLFRRRFEAVYNAVKLVLRQRSFLHGRHLEAVNGLRRGDSIFLRRRNCGDSRFLPRKRHIYVGTGCAALPALFAEELFLAAANRRSGGFVLILHRFAVDGYVYLNILTAGCVRRAVLLHLFVVNILDLFTGFFCSVGNSPEGGSGDEHEHRRNKHKLHYYSRRSAHKRKPGNAEHYGKHAAAHKLLAVVIELPYFGKHSAGKLHAVRKNCGYAAEQQHKGKTLPALRRSGKCGALHGVHHRKVDENRTYEVCAPSEKPEYRVMQPLPKVLSPHEGKRREYNAQCKEQNRIELPLIGAFLRLFRGLGILFTLSCLFFCHLYILSKKSFGFCRL